jgi:hypothetical protein
LRGDAEAGGEEVEAADAGDHLHLDGPGEGGGEVVEHAQGAVVQRRVAPHEEAAGAATVEGAHHRVAQHRDPLPVPAGHRRVVVPIGQDPGRVVHGHDGEPRGSVAAQELAPQGGEVVELLALVEDEHDIERADGVGRLEGQQARVARADPDHEQASGAG